MLDLDRKISATIHIQAELLMGLSSAGSSSLDSQEALTFAHVELSYSASPARRISSARTPIVWKVSC